MKNTRMRHFKKKKKFKKLFSKGPRENVFSGLAVALDVPGGIRSAADDFVILTTHISVLGSLSVCRMSLSALH